MGVRPESLLPTPRSLLPFTPLCDFPPLRGIFNPAMTDAYLLTNADALVARAQTGDAAALEALYRAFESPVYNLARRICRTAEDAEDVLQETFFEVCRSIGRYRG